MLKYLRYSAPKDNQLIGEFVEQYDMLIINAHISSFFSKAVSSFFHGNASHYVIDPRTFVFQMPPSELYKDKSSEISASYKKLFNSHYPGEVVSKFLCTTNGLNIEELEEFYPQIFSGGLNSQINAFSGTSYKGLLSPSVLLSPSFALLKEYSVADIERVLHLNIRSVNDCNQAYGMIYNIGAVLILDKEILLQENILQSIIDSYSNTQMSFLYLWIDDFKCFGSDTNILKAYKKLINGLKKHNIIDLYADYSSFMLCSGSSPAPMCGVCVTAGYNESRGIRGVMGMTPAAKYYMQDIHMRFPPADYLKILAAREFFDDGVPTAERAKRFYREICDCPVCRDVIGSDINNIRKFTQVVTTRGGRQQSASSSLVLAQRHFLYAKLKEAANIEFNDYKALSRQMEDALLEYADYGLTGLQGIGYWLSVFI